MFLIISGSSGSGKNTVIKEMQKFKNNLIMMPTFTTREKRDGEVEGMPYFYISKDEFQSKIKDGEFIEHEYIHNNYYGSSHKVFDEYISMGKILTKDIGVEGAQNLTQKLKEKTKIIKIFLAIKNKKELKNRLIGRGEKQIKLRLKRFAYEKKQMNKFDFIIFNENLQSTSNKILKILNTDENQYYFKKDFNKINNYKVKYYMNKLLSGKTLKPIKVVIGDDKIYVIKGVEKFVASQIVKKPVAKLVVDKQIDKSQFIYKID